MNMLTKKAVSLNLGNAAVLSLCLAACAASDQDSETAPETERQASEQFPIADGTPGLTLLARIDMEGASLRFYETEPGTILEVESGRVDAKRAREPAGLTPVQRYEFLAGTRAPEALIDAAGRAGVTASFPEEAIREVGKLAPNDKATAEVPPDWFLANYCTATDRFWGSGPYAWNGDSTFRDEVEYMRAGAYVLPNWPSVSYRMGYAGGSLEDKWHDVKAGWYVGFKQSSVLNRTASSAVRNANTSRYFHCVNYHY